MPLQPIDTDGLAEDVEAYNSAVAAAAKFSPFQQHPISAVRWVHIDQVRANNWNPNAVAHQEMRLLHTSIAADGYTQPVVVVEDDNQPGRYIVVDGFHRTTILRRYADILASTGGYLPVVVLNKTIAEQMASTVRHNRARGKHSVAGMSNLVFAMLQEGRDDADICNELGLEPEELARLKHITGFAKLHADHRYGRATLTDRQVRIKGDYHRAHPDDPIPADI